MEPHRDLLSGDDFLSPHADNSLALVPISEPSATPPSNQQNMLELALVDMFAENNNAPGSLVTQAVPPATQPTLSTSQFQQQHPPQTLDPAIYSNGALNTMQPPYEQAPYLQSTHFNHNSDSSWNGQGAQSSDPQQQALVYGSNGTSSCSSGIHMHTHLVHS